MCIESPSGWDIGGIVKDIVPVRWTVDNAVDAVEDSEVAI